MQKIIYCLLLLTLLSSCITRIDKKGYAFELSDYHLLQEGVTSEESVIEIMGSPTIVSDLRRNESWLYYSEDVENFLFFFPKITNRTIFVISFDDTKTIKDLRKFDLDDEKEKLKFVTQYTSIKAHKIGFIKSIFSNIGQIKPQ